MCLVYTSERSEGGMGFPPQGPPDLPKGHPEGQVGWPQWWPDAWDGMTTYFSYLPRQRICTFDLFYDFCGLNMPDVADFGVTAHQGKILIVCTGGSPILRFFLD